MKWELAAAQAADAVVNLQHAQRLSKSPWNDRYGVLVSYAQRCHIAALAMCTEPDAAQRERLATEYRVYRTQLYAKVRDWFPEAPDGSPE